MCEENDYLDDQPIPPSVPGVLNHLGDVGAVRRFLSAYYEPSLTHPCGEPHPDRQYRVGAGLRLVVTSDGLVLHVEPHITVEPAGPSPLFMEAAPQRRRRGRGGSGTRYPTTVRELIRRAESAGAQVTTNHRHYFVHVAGWERAVLVPVSPSPSDFAALRNAAREMHRNGLDVMRPCR